MKTLALLLVLILGFAAYVRLAPSDPARWHRPVPDLALGDHPREGSFAAVRGGANPDTLARIDAIARATPRTTVLAGSVAEGRITYITRSRLWGFPDYTTVERSGDRITLFGRLRFGRGDMGVNKARIEGWLAQVGL
ncbi:DUF1499 domain-containing protein [Marivivens marinus]|uniref:DUF1499 domain-containing protein n=1 Tax=Marivivens marinus TaxID=3110173 RepID=UPI003B8495B7